MDEPKSADLHIRMRPSVKEALKETARRRGTTVTDLLTEAGLREAGQELAREHREDETDG